MPIELVYMINRFGNAKGFDHFQHIFKTANSLSTINLILGVITKVSNHFFVVHFSHVVCLPKIRRIVQLDFFSQWVISAKETIFSYILDASDSQFKTFSEDHIQSILTHMEMIIASISSTSEAMSIIEDFKLKLVLKGLKSDSLTRKIKAINDLVVLTRKASGQVFNPTSTVLNPA